MSTQKDPINADYDAFISAWRKEFPVSHRAPLGTFPDMNLMAGEVLGYYRLADDELYQRWAEVSWGCSFMRGRVIGITIARPGSDAWIARTGGVEVFDNMASAVAHLRSLISGKG